MQIDFVRVYFHIVAEPSFTLFRNIRDQRLQIDLVLVLHCFRTLFRLVCIRNQRMQIDLGIVHFYIVVELSFT